MTTPDTRVSTPLAARVLTAPRRTEADALWTAKGHPSESLLDPALAGDTVVTASGRTLRGYDLATGRETWKRGLDDAVLVGAVPGPAGVALAVTRGAVLAVEAGTGRVLWERSLDTSRFQKAVRLGQEGLLLASRGSVLTALESRTGETRWTATLPLYRGFREEYGLGAVAASTDGATVVAAIGPRLVTLDGATGEQRAEAMAPAAPHSVAVGDDGRVYAASPSGAPGVAARVSGFDGGGLVFDHALDTSPLPQRPRVAAGAEGVFVGTSDGQVLALDPAGEVRWTSRAQDGAVADLAVAGEDLLVTGTGRESRVKVLDSASGATRWESPTRGTRLTVPAAGGEGVVVAAEGWSLHAFQDPRIREAREIREALEAAEVPPAPEICESAGTVRIGDVELSIRGA